MNSPDSCEDYQPKGILLETSLTRESLPGVKLSVQLKHPGPGSRRTLWGGLGLKKVLLTLKQPSQRVSLSLSPQCVRFKWGLGKGDFYMGMSGPWQGTGQETLTVGGKKDDIGARLRSERGELSALVEKQSDRLHLWVEGGDKGVEMGYRENRKEENVEVSWGGKLGSKIKGEESTSNYQYSGFLEAKRYWTEQKAFFQARL